MARINFIPHNIELWFWTVLINLISSNTRNNSDQPAESKVRPFSMESVVKVILGSAAGFLIGFAIGALFL